MAKSERTITLTTRVPISVYTAVINEAVDKGINQTDYHRSIILNRNTHNPDLEELKTEKEMLHRNLDRAIAQLKKWGETFKIQ